MKLLRLFLRKDRRLRRISPLEQGQDFTRKVGREQFKKLVDKGLGVPVAYL